MYNTKFTMNALVIIVIIFSAIGLFFTIKLVNMADRIPINEYYPIEETDLGVRYSSLEPNGIYQGSEAAGELVLEGNYGMDWGAFLEGDDLFINEYRMTDLGLVLCDLVKINVNTLEKEVLMKDTFLRGKCASGELVCLGGCIMPSSYPQTNPLMKLYSMASSDIRPEGESAEVIFIDPKTGETAYSFRDDHANSSHFDDRYLRLTLEEVKKS